VRTVFVLPLISLCIGFGQTPKSSTLCTQDRARNFLVKDKNPDSRKQAVQALDLASPREPYLSQLEAMLDDKDVEVRLATITSLVDLQNSQEPVSTWVNNLVSQDTPWPDDPVQIPVSGPVPPASASVAGTVRDADGVAVPGARVRLAPPNNGVDRETTADSRGAFTFSELVPGLYRLEISEVGLDRPVTVEVVLGAGERRELPIVGTRILTTTVHVVASLNEVAQSQVEAQETQRVLGIFPNYYSSYIWDAAPMTPKLKFKLALRATTDPISFLAAAGLAGVEQKHHTFPGYGQGSEGYAKRFGAAYADAFVSKMVSRAILPTVLHQDPRYFYRGSGSIGSRIFYALRAAVITRGDNGRMQPNYSQVLGNFASSGISNLYRAPSDRTASLTFRNGLIMTASGAVENLLREFFSRKLTSNLPSFANGKP
jgi:Carboxypeptidase regulatory-like domain